ncbi:hypothetical protein GE061_009089 [Apolygus lucorum]|uniref:Uncharacterized protein n=1 Tax=Apolygus lucorum TaxID=248454 RepID=A0A8S9Y0P0_APOLU|nr:hypothetical protein GE061_009089 [Apolygus lucorum]
MNDPQEQMQLKFQAGFGAQLLNAADGGGDDGWKHKWQRIATLQGKQYPIPQGNVGRKFVEMLTAEIMGVVNGSHTSERIFVFCASVLQREHLVKSPSDIKRSVCKRMELWGDGKFDEVVQEAVRCDKKLKRKTHLMPNQQQRARLMTRLVSCGRLRDATRWATERGGGGVLMPEQMVSEGKTVRDVLEEKHTPQKLPAAEMFMSDDLPFMMEANVTSGHIESAAHKLKGSAGPSGTDAEQWRNLLLRYGGHSGRLRDAVAALTRMLANSIVEWDVIKALLARRGVALDKRPGVRPIGVGEVLQRICAKTMAKLTGKDLEDECGSNQLCAGTKTGIEGAVHAIAGQFEAEEGCTELNVEDHAEQVIREQKEERARRKQLNEEKSQQAMEQTFVLSCLGKSSVKQSVRDITRQRFHTSEVLYVRNNAS